MCRALAEGAVTGKRDVFEKLLAPDFLFQGTDRQAIMDRAARAVKQYQIYEIHISSFQVEELSADAAKAYFRAAVHSRQEEGPYVLACRGSFVKQNGIWKLKDIRFYNPLVNQTQEIQIP